MLWLADVVTWGTVAWVVVLFVLGAGAVTSVIGVATAADRGPRATETGRAVTENGWALIAAVVLVILVGTGVDVSVHLALDEGEAFVGVLVFVGAVLVAVFGALGVLALALRGGSASYAVLRANLAEHPERQLTSEQVDAFRAQLARIDERHRRIRFGLRDRSGLRAIRARLDAMAAELAVVPAAGLGAVGRVRWKTANAYLWRANPWRLAPAVLALVVGAAAIVDAEPLTAIVALVATALSFLFALLASRLALGAKVAQHAVNQVRRADAVCLLDEREKTARRRTAGLGDRVTRALQILRDQQG
ncbi:hypothetical protein QT381_06255 [Galbitalea sp. SE-J8]|uniref:hypothetical protein n=1 Tax=Galbitalea sp. SE-J8 TaxID=3054952 RepID=UPI00259CCB8E|nr:hypothetical protein [Galbitalea sp. SE-J8]MDM4762604.1 hypothetical protein [Galbitalea sp. SE-J8]